MKNHTICCSDLSVVSLRPEVRNPVQQQCGPHRSRANTEQAGTTCGNAARRISQHRVKGQHLQEFIDADKLNDEGRLEKKYQNSTSMRAAKRAKPQPESDGGSEEISNAELAANLPSKIVANASCFGKRKRLLYLSLKWVV
ncbi:hypothetical protein JOM56_014187 [Amanita muscaria]